MRSIDCLKLGLLLALAGSVLLGLEIRGAGAAEVLAVGSFRGGQVFAKSGQVWYGLYRSRHGYELRASKMQVIRV